MAEAYLPPIPKNAYGIFACPCDSREDALTESELQAIFDGPIAAAQPALDRSLQEILDLSIPEIKTQLLYSP